ncbi:MAG: hypothetical protein ABI867_09065 [Kofleriaceae bacterium]
MALLAGCPSDGDDGNDPAQLAGEWSAVGDEDISLTLGDDGSYTIVDDNGPETGTFSADATTLTITGPTSVTQVGYAVRGDSLLLNALSPVGSADGLVAKWHGEVTQGADEQTIDLDLKADHTLVLDIDSTEDGPLHATGTWVETGDELITTLDVQGTSVDISFHTLDDIAIGNPLFERVQ